MSAHFGFKPVTIKETYVEDKVKELENLVVNESLEELEKWFMEVNNNIVLWQSLKKSAMKVGIYLYYKVVEQNGKVITLKSVSYKGRTISCSKCENH